ncbi:hypothetical protein IAT38_000670 [Cryptococcus sp. DSM 104549]
MSPSAASNEPQPSPSTLPSISPGNTNFPPSPGTSKQHIQGTDWLPTLPLGRSTSHLSRSLSPHRPLRDDGLDNNPPQLLGSSLELERRLTVDPDLERQMGMDDDGVGPPPEGGLKAWSVVVASFSALFAIFGFLTTFGQLKTYYLDNQLSTYTESDVAWIGSMQALVTYAGSIAMGRYFDSHGARLLAIIATVLSTGALVGLAFCKEYYQFFLAHLLFGISGTIIYSPAAAATGHWFLRRRPLAVCVVICGSGAGGVIYPLALRAMLKAMSFRNSFLTLAGVNLAIMLVVVFFLTARLPPRRPPPLRALLGPWKEIRYFCLVAGTWMIMFNWFTPYFNAPLLFTGNNLSSNLASYSIAIMQGAAFAGRLAAVFLANRFGVRGIFTLSTLGCSVTIFAFWTPSDINTATAIVGLVSHGFASGAWFALVSANCGAISPTREFGMRLGMMWTTTSVATLIGPVISGVLIGNNDGKFSHAGAFVGATHFLGCVITAVPQIIDFVSSRRMAQRRKGEEVSVGADPT